MVSSDRAKTVILSTVAPALLLAGLLAWQWRSTACTFGETAPGSSLYLCRQRRAGRDMLSAALAHVPRREGWLWGRRQVDHWVMVDAGAPDSLLRGSYASSLAKAVQRKLAPARRGATPGHLGLIILTHANAVGALPQLVQAYPDAVVAVHADEIPLLSSRLPRLLHNATSAPLSSQQQPQQRQRQSQQQAKPGGLGGGAAAHLPADRLLLLHGDGADLADVTKSAGGAAKKALRWLPRGVLRFIKAAEPTPGSLAVVHAPSGAMLAGAAVALHVPSLLGVGGAAAGLLAPPSAIQQAAAKRLIVEEGYRWLLPFPGGNISRQQAEEAAQGWPEHAPPPPAQEAGAATAAAAVAQRQQDAPSGRTSAEGGSGGAGVAAHGSSPDAALTSTTALETDGLAHDTAAAGLGLSPGHHVHWATASAGASGGHPGHRSPDDVVAGGQAAEL